ncbi:aspartate aminotransferase, cytoplasmic-like isoform X2 [Eleutherodactylus coqui]|uniref:aspartate aminotransferase, cytoplasmic-like isoform X2 n=1 Tax=Eleutherodactylus coqui TaxID=57060 RepID=UPI003462306E
MTTLSVFLDVPKSIKVLLSEDGQPWVPLPVKRVYLQIVNDPTRNYEHLPVTGAPEYIRGVTEFALGKNSKAILQNRASGVQTPGTTGAFRLGAKFLHRWYNINKKTSVCIAQLAYDRYRCLFEAAGLTNICPYRFWDNKNMGLALPEMLEDLEKSPDFSIVVLPTSCNPTGIQLSSSDWKQIADVMKRKSMFPFFHLKDQGLASGDVDTDAWPVRYFVSEDFELFCAQSFSASFGLYGERIGNLLIVLRSNDILISVRSQLESLAHEVWSTPPCVGSRVVATVLNNPSFYMEWKASLKMVVRRLMIIREKTREKLRLLESLKSWEHITKQAGPFAFLGLTSSQVDILAKKRHIYLPECGQMNISGLNANNLDYVAQSVHDVTMNDDLSCSSFAENYLEYTLSNMYSKMVSLESTGHPSASIQNVTNHLNAGEQKPNRSSDPKGQ